MTLRGRAFARPPFLLPFLCIIIGIWQKLWIPEKQGGILLKKHRALILLTLFSLSLTLALPTYALLLPDDSEEVSVAAFAKNGTINDRFTFSPSDFVVSGDAELSSVIIDSLPATETGLLKLGNEEVHEGDSIAMSAVSGLRFYPLSSPTVSDTSFTFTPVFSDGLTGESVTVSLYVLAESNSAPIAENLEIKTYKNVSVSGQFAAVDPDGDILTFQLVSKPARGMVEISEDGSGNFIYTPYENKSGKDSFTYVAVDSVGNISAEATVKITISKAKTKVTYADMSGHASYRSAIRLAEEGILVGAQVDGTYYFQPDLPVSREEFVVMAMSAAGLDSLEGISVTGFSDDSSIPVWAKGYISSALRSGVVTGCLDADGAVCFNSGSTITKTEASVILDRLLNVSDVANVDAFAESVPAWASQSVANMSAVSVLTDLNDMSGGLTRAQAADMLCAMLDVLDNRDTGWL